MQEPSKDYNRLCFDCRMGILRLLMQGGYRPAQCRDRSDSR